MYSPHEETDVLFSLFSGGDKNRAKLLQFAKIRNNN